MTKYKDPQAHKVVHSLQTMKGLLRGQLRRFWSKVDKHGPDQCWEWKGRVTKEGYGCFVITKNSVHNRIPAHRLAYELAIKPIPDGLTIDHLCRNRRCVNPRHLEPVKVRENILRGQGPSARNFWKTECHRGHVFDKENTYIDPKRGDRQCRACMRLRYRLRLNNTTHFPPFE